MKFKNLYSFYKLYGNIFDEDCDRGFDYGIRADILNSPLLDLITS